MAYLEALWPALCSGPLEQILQHLTLADCNALQRALRQLRRADGQRYDLRDALPKLALRQAWDPCRAARAGNLAALHYHCAYLQGVVVVDINRVLENAAARGRLSVMHYCYRRGASLHDYAMLPAARNGRLSAMKLCKEQGATNYERALEEAAGGGKLEAMRLCIEWGATNIEKAMEDAAFGGHTPAMELCKEYGATNFESALGFVEYVNERWKDGMMP